MIPIFQGLSGSLNTAAWAVIFGLVFGLIFGLYREGVQKGKLRGQMEVLQMKYENIQAANKDLSAQNYRLNKDMRDFEKTKELYVSLQSEYTYVSAFKDSVQNRYEKLYKQTTGKSIKAEKEIKIENKRGRR